MPLIKSPSFLNVVASGVAGVYLPLGNIINRIHLYMGGTTPNAATMISRIVVKMNQTIIYDVTGAHLKVMNAFRGLTDNTAHLCIDFTEPCAINYGTENLGGIDTSKGVQSLSVEVTTSGAPANVTLDAWLDVSPADPMKQENNPGLFMALIPMTLPITAAGKFTFPQPCGANRAHRVKRFHLFGSIITDVGVKKDSLYVFEAVTAAVNNERNAHYGRVSQSNHYAVDFLLKGDAIENLFLGNARNLDVEVNASGAGTITLYTEAVTRLDWI